MRVRNFIASVIPPDKTREQIARAVGISRVHLQWIIAGTQIPSIEIALRLSHVLEKPVEALFRLEYEGVAAEQEGGLRPSRKEKADEPALETLVQGSETILLVEDDAPLRRLIREFLENIGYQVLEAKGGAEAVQLSEEHTGPIHALLTDVVMPGINGRELAQRLEVMRPAMAVLYVSGYTDDAVVRQAISDRGSVFLQKPVPLETLAQKLRYTLDARKKG